MGAQRTVRAVCVLAAVGCAAWAWRYEQTLHDAAESPSFGRTLGDSLAEAAGNIALVTANDTCTTLLRSGASYSEWHATEYPLPRSSSSSTAPELFVQSVRYNGNLLVVGATARARDTDGTVYAYRTGAGARTAPQVIAPPAGRTRDTRFFATEIAVAATSAHFAVALPAARQVAVYENATPARDAPLALVGVLDAPAPAPGAFGASLTMSDNVLVVGAPVLASRPARGLARTSSSSSSSSSSEEAEAGAVYTFLRVNGRWECTPSVLAPAPAHVPHARARALFGYALDITKDGTRLVVTAPCVEPPVLLRRGPGASAPAPSSEEECVPKALVYMRAADGTGWQLMYSVAAPAGAQQTSFGASVSINPEQGDLFVGVGAPSEEPATSAMYLYRNTRLYAHIPSPRDAYAFGRSMTMYGDILAVGVPMQSIGRPPSSIQQQQQQQGTNSAAGLGTPANTLNQMGGIVMFSITQLSDHTMTLVMTCSLAFFLVVVTTVLAIYKLHPSSIAALRQQQQQQQQQQHRR